MGIYIAALVQRTSCRSQTCANRRTAIYGYIECMKLDDLIGHDEGMWMAHSISRRYRVDRLLGELMKCRNVPGAEYYMLLEFVRLKRVEVAQYGWRQMQVDGS